MFKNSARFYDVIYQFKDYTAAADEILRIIGERLPNARSLLDVGCGTGRHLETFAGRFDVEGLDLNPGLLNLARQRLPNVAFHEADMTGFHLGRRFDVVTCLFSAIGYAKTLDRMRAAVQRMAEHLNPVGLIIIEPWFTPESYWTHTITANFVNEPQLKIAWMYTSERVENLSVLDIHYMVGTPAGVEEFTEIHEIGLFTQAEYLEALDAAGLKGEYHPGGVFGRGLYIARRQ